MSPTILDRVCTLRYELPDKTTVDLLLEEFRVKALIVDGVISLISTIESVNK